MVLQLVCAVVPRCLFVLVSLIGVWRVTWVKDEPHFWLLTILYLPLLLELLLTLRRRKGHDYKWFSPAILFFLISIIPTIWILELHHQQNKVNFPKCGKLDSSDNIRSLISDLKNSTNTTDVVKILKSSANVLSSVCANDWILALNQILLILLIVGKWLMPIGGGITRDELSQLLLIFVGTAADILEFTSETLSDVKDKSPDLVYIILAVWTWSMLQFPFHLSVVTTKDEEEPETLRDSLLSKYRTDLWTLAEALLIQDGPFLVVRLTVMIHYDIFHQMLVFFTIKNLMVVTLNVYRIWVIFQDYRSL